MTEYTIRIRRATAAQWASANPVLALAEPGYETDTGRMKNGDGTTAWNSLRYASGNNGEQGTINVCDFGAVPDNGTADNAAIADAMDEGKVIFFPEGTYHIDMSGSEITVPDGTIFIGHNVVLKSLQTSITDPGQHPMFVTQSGGKFRAEGITFQGPTTLIDDDEAIPQGSSTEVYLVQLYGENATFEAVDCKFKNASFYVYCSSHDTGVDLERCEFFGWGGGTKCTGILFSDSGTDRWLKLRDCIFRDFGLSGNNFFHCLYIDDGVSVDVKRCKFLTHYGTGFYMQLHDGFESANHCVIKDNYFGPYAEGADTSKCINTSNMRPGTVTTIEGNTFAAQNHCIEVDGDCVIRKNRFVGDGSGATNNFWILGTESNATIEISDNDFIGEIDNPIRIDWNTSHWKIKGNRWRGTYVECINLEDSLSASRVEVLDNDFTSPNIGDYCIHARGGGTLTVARNTFAPTLTGQTCIRLSSPGTLSRLVIKDNDFSQTGTVDTSIDVSSVRPSVANLIISGNYGATGFKTRNQGYTAVADGGNIAHGLGSTTCSIEPTKFGISPTGAGGNRVINIVGKDSTNLVVENKKLVSTTGDSVGSENVNWWAEY